MSEVLETVYASAPSNDMVYHTLEFIDAAFPNGVMRLVKGFDDEVFGLENAGGDVLYSKSGFAVSLPKKSIRGNQSIQFQLDNVTGEILGYLNAALSGGNRVPVKYRTYLESDRSAPAKAPVVMTLTSMTANYKSVKVVADFNDFLNKVWPTLRYTPSLAPGLKYI
jgi:hypothetical protein